MTPALVISGVDFVRLPTDSLIVIGPTVVRSVVTLHPYEVKPVDVSRSREDFLTGRILPSCPRARRHHGDRAGRTVPIYRVGDQFFVLVVQGEYDVHVVMITNRGGSPIVFFFFFQWFVLFYRYTIDRWLQYNQPATDFIVIKRKYEEKKKKLCHNMT